MNSNVQLIIPKQHEANTVLETHNTAFVTTFMYFLELFFPKKTFQMVMNSALSRKTAFTQHLRNKRKNNAL